MNLLHLQYFYVVAKENGFTKASKVLRIQQPAISRMVGQLEQDFGFKLFEKVGRNIRLTGKGLEVFYSCQKIFGEVDQLKVSLGKLSQECQGPLLLAASEPITSHFLPALLQDYLAQHPKVHPNIYSGPASMLLERLLSGELELGLFFHLPDLPERLEVFKKIDFKYHLVIKKELKKNPQVIESFIGSREIDDTSTRSFPTLDKLKKDHPKARIKISSNNLTAHKEMVLKGLGCSILPDFLVRQELKSGLLADLYPEAHFKFQMKLVKRKTSTLSFNAEKFLEVLSRFTER